MYRNTRILINLNTTSSYCCNFFVGPMVKNSYEKNYSTKQNKCSVPIFLRPKDKIENESLMIMI